MLGVARQKKMRHSADKPIWECKCEGVWMEVDVGQDNALANPPPDPTQSHMQYGIIILGA